MNRRWFLKAVATVAGVAVADPEILIWKPEKTIFIPPAPTLYRKPLVVGVARNNIAAGNYGYVQIYGTWCQAPILGPSSNYSPTFGAARRIRAETEIKRGQIVMSNECDYGTAPLWYTNQGQEVMDTFNWRDDVQREDHSKTS